MDDTHVAGTPPTAPLTPEREAEIREHWKNAEGTTALVYSLRVGLIQELCAAVPDLLDALDAVRRDLAQARKDVARLTDDLHETIARTQEARKDADRLREAIAAIAEEWATEAREECLLFPRTDKAIREAAHE